MARKVNSISPFNVTALALGLAFLYLPIVILVIYSFNASRLVTVWGGWSLRWYYEFFNDGWNRVTPYAIPVSIVGMISSEISIALELHGKEQTCPCRLAVHKNGAAAAHAMLAADLRAGPAAVLA